MRQFSLITAWLASNDFFIGHVKSLDYNILHKVPKMGRMGLSDLPEVL